MKGVNNSKKMTVYDEYVYLVRLSEPYITYKIVNGELTRFFKENTPSEIFVAQKKIEEIIKSPFFELPR